MLTAGVILKQVQSYPHSIISCTGAEKALSMLFAALHSFRGKSKKRHFNSPAPFLLLPIVMGSGIELEEQFPCETPPGPNPKETDIYPSKPAKMSINCPKMPSSAYPRTSESASLITLLIELFFFCFQISNPRSTTASRVRSSDQQSKICN
jgi:hypothetical protein